MKNLPTPPASYDLAIKLESIRQDLLRNGILTYDNPLEYRGYLIYHNDPGWDSKYAFVHSGYDGASDAHDNRCGLGKTIDDCILQINEQIEESIPADTVMIRVNGGREEIELEDFIADNTDDGRNISPYELDRLSELNRLRSMQIGEEVRIGGPETYTFIRRTR